MNHTQPRPSKSHLLVAALALLGVAPACDRAPRPATAATDAPSPRKAVEALIAARNAGDYAQVERLVIPGRSNEVVETLLAFDEFLAANADLCRFVRDEIAPALADAIDQSHLGSNLDIFSPFIELLDERIDGETATIGFVVDGRLPARSVRLQRVDGAWRYDPGPGYTPELPAAFRRMARGLRELLAELRSGALPPAAVREDRQRLLDAVRDHLLPGVRMLPPPKAAP